MKKLQKKFKFLKISKSENVKIFVTKKFFKKKFDPDLEHPGFIFEFLY